MAVPTDCADSQISRRAMLAGTAAGAALAMGVPLPRGAVAQTPSAAALILRAIPKTGELVPAIGLGSFETFDIAPGEPRGHLREVLKRFHEAGGRVVDTSPLYGMAEVNIGDFAADLGITDDLFVANKIWATGEWLSNNDQAEEQLRRSTERLWRRRMDVMQVHSLTNEDQILPLLRRWKDEGRIRYVAVTHWNAEYYDTLERLARAGNLDFIQLNYSIFSRSCEERLLPACADHGVAVLTSMPFEKSRLFNVVEEQPVPDFAGDFGANSWAQFFLKFVISHPAVTAAIPATSNPDHVADNMAALRGELPDAAMRARMVRHMETIDSFAGTLRLPPYRDKGYGGVVAWPFS